MSLSRSFKNIIVGWNQFASFININTSYAITTYRIFKIIIKIRLFIRNFRWCVASKKYGTNQI